MSILDHDSQRLGPTGKLLWDHLHPSLTPDGATEILALQICRIADRLDRLDAIIRSKKTWIELADEADDRGHVSVVVDNVLSEYRQQSLALSTLLNKVGAGKLSEVIAQATEDKSDELRSRREQKLAGLSGTEDS